MDPDRRETEPGEVSAALLARYLYDTCSPEERAQVGQWLSAEPRRGGALEQLERMCEVGRQAESPVDVEAFWARLSNRIDTTGEANAVRGAREGRVWARHRNIVSAVLAAAIVLMVVGVLVRSHLAAWRGSLTGSVSAPATRYLTQNGQRAQITLPDGSTVMLDVASQIDVPRDFETTHRVRLSGEALFTVAHHDGAPFVVATGTTEARVLGTSFAVRQYPGDTMATVAVREGKIAVGASVVTAWQQGDVLRDGTVHVQPANEAPFTFASGVLTLTGVPLRDAIPDLNRWYDVQVVLANPDSPLAGQLVNGAFSAGPPSDVVTILSFMFNTRVERHGRVITIYSK